MDGGCLEPPAHGLHRRVLWARPWTAIAFAHDNPLKLSETLKEVYCNVNNLSLAASVFLILAGAGCPLWPLPRTHMPRAALPLMLPKPANGRVRLGLFPPGCGAWSRCPGHLWVCQASLSGSGTELSEGCWLASGPTPKTPVPRSQWPSPVVSKSNPTPLPAIRSTAPALSLSSWRLGSWSSGKLVGSWGSAPPVPLGCAEAVGVAPGWSLDCGPCPGKRLHPGRPWR